MVDFKLATSYYHLPLSSETIDNIVRTVGDKMYNYIQEVYNNPEAKTNNITEDQIIDLWYNYIGNITWLSEEVKDALISSIGITVTKKILNLRIANEVLSSIYEQKNKLEDDFSDFILKSGHLQARLYVEIMQQIY